VTVAVIVASGTDVSVAVTVAFGNGKVVTLWVDAQAARSNNSRRIDTMRFMFIHREDKWCAKFF